MIDKFSEYYSGSEDRIAELSEYVHLNYRIIWVKMISEMRRKLDIPPSQTNEEGYTSLMVTLQGRLFNEMVYALAATCQGLQMKLQEVIPSTTLIMLLNLMKGENPMGGKLREVVADQETFNAYYLQEIDALRAEIEALPK